MKKLAVWASHHIWTSRILITLFYIAIILLASATGIFLFEQGFHFMDCFFYGLTILYISLISIYPNKKAAIKASFYQRKTIDFAIIITTFFMFCFIANKSDRNYINTFSANAATTPITNIVSGPVTKTSIAIDEPNAVKKPKLTKSKQRKQLRAMVHAFKKKFNDQSTGVKILLILLMLLVAAALFYGVAALSCSIACSSGSGAAAGSGVVFYGGTALILVGLFFGIRRVIKGPRKPKKVPEP